MIAQSYSCLSNLLISDPNRWTQSIAVGDKSFLDQIKDRLGMRAKGRKVHGSEDEYHLREGQTDYGGW